MINSSITGAGSLTKNGSNTLTLSGDNSGFTSVMRINAGTLRAGSAMALGPSGAIITNGAKLDIYGRTLGTAPITASGSGPSGEGAIVSTAGAQGAGVASVTLAGDTTFGGA